MKTSLRMLCVGLCGVVISALLAGCLNPERDLIGPLPEDPNAPHARAERLTSAAAEVISSDPAKAERLLLEAIDADEYYGPAHNDLGVVYMNAPSPKLFEAANQFESAKKLMPGHPDPRFNYGMLLERAGRNDDALAAYRAALETDPAHIASMQALASLQIRLGMRDQQTTALLRTITLRGTDESWRDWAKRQLEK